MTSNQDQIGEIMDPELEENSVNCLEKQFKGHVDQLFEKLRLKEEQIQKFLTSQTQALEEEKYNLKEREKTLEEDYQKRFKSLEDSEKKMKEDHEAEIEQMKSLNEVQEGKIKLDVGGHMFTTSKSTLSHYDPNCMFAVMFSGRHNNIQSEDGSYFIDRDGTYFRYILNYLRGVIVIPSDLPEDVSILKELRGEADFYQLKGLLELIDEALDTPGGKIDYTQEEITEMMSTLVRDDVCGNGARNPTSYLNRENSNEDNSGNRAHFISQNITKSKLNFTNKKLNGISFAHTTFFHDVSFRNACLAGASFYGCEFGVGVKISFNFADLSNCDFRQCKGKEAGGSLNFGHGGGLLSVSSSDTFLQMIQQGRITFKKAKMTGASFDQKVCEYLKEQGLTP